MGLTMKPREMINFLTANGYTFVRAKNGSHHIYSNGAVTVPVPIHEGREFDEKFIRLVLHETGISKSELLTFLKR